MNSYTSYRYHYQSQKVLARRANYLGAVGSTIAGGISYDLRKILSIIYDEDVAKHFEMGEIRRDTLNLFIVLRLRVLERRSFQTYLQPGDERVVGVEIRDQLESAVQGDDLPFDVFLEDAE
jgi:hypothetical protein